MNLKRILLSTVGAVLVFALYRLLQFTWRVRLYEPDSLKLALQRKSPVVLAHWHGDEISLIQLVSRYKIATITSTSDDGEMMNRVLKLLGAKTSRGSSTRGGVGALKGLISFAKQGLNSSFAVDGPKGPIYKVKPGIFELSKILHRTRTDGGQIFPAGVACESKWVFRKSWNQAYLPKPFAKIVVYWGEPLPAVEDLDAHDLDLADRLERSLRAAQASALKKFAT